MGPPSSAPPGEKFGKYQLIRKLASGGMGEVHLAKQSGLVGFEKTVVIKRILAKHLDKQAYVDMFFSEARVAALLTHSNIVQIYDMGQEGEHFFIAMEYVNGRSLREVIDLCNKTQQPIPLGHILEITAQVCAGMSYAHNMVDPNGNPLNLVHRDINPQNLLISYHGECKVIDFGIAKSSVNTHKTEAGTIKGKYVYMSPEQSAADSLDKRSDLFALGIVMYEMCTGVNPFHHNTIVASLEAIQRKEPAPLDEKRPDAAPFAPIVRLALTKNRDQRYVDATDIRQDVMDLLQSGQIPRTQETLAEYMVNMFRDRGEISSPVLRTPSSGSGSTRPGSSATGKAHRSSPALSTSSVGKVAPPSTSSAAKVAPPSSSGSGKAVPPSNSSVGKAVPPSNSSVGKAVPPSNSSVGKASPHSSFPSGKPAVSPPPPPPSHPPRTPAPPTGSPLPAAGKHHHQVVPVTNDAEMFPDAAPTVLEAEPMAVRLAAMEGHAPGKKPAPALNPSVVWALVGVLAALLVLLAAAVAAKYLGYWPHGQPAPTSAAVEPQQPNSPAPAADKTGETPKAADPQPAASAEAPATSTAVSASSTTASGASTPAAKGPTEFSIKVDGNARITVGSTTSTGSAAWKAVEPRGEVRIKGSQPLEVKLRYTVMDSGIQLSLAATPNADVQINGLGAGKTPQQTILRQDIVKLTFKAGKAGTLNVNLSVKPRK